MARRPTSPPEPNPMQVEALRLAKLGIHVVRAHVIDQWGRCGCGDRRCRDRGVHLVNGGDLEATTDPDLIRRWWPSPAPRRGHNLLVLSGRKSGVFALVVSRDRGGLENPATLEQRHGPLPPTASCEFARGDRYILFRLPPGVIPGRRVFPADGVYTVYEGQAFPVPPTSGALNGPMAWLARPEDGIADAPDWVLRAAGYVPGRPVPTPPPPPPAAPPLPIDEGLNAAALEVQIDAAFRAAIAAQTPAQEPLVGPYLSTAYGMAAVRRAAETIRLCGSVGGAPVQLEAAKLFRLVLDGRLALNDLRYGLFVAGRKAGLADAVTLQAIETGLAAGARSPRRGHR